jgi:tetratricopeptide (TPR) repeat protein
MITLLAAPPVLAVLLPLPARTRRRDAVALALLIGVALGYLALRWAAGPVLPDRAPNRLDNPIVAVDGFARVGAALAVFGRYIALTVWPYPLSVDYSYDALGISEDFSFDAYSAVGLLSIAALAFAAVLNYRKRPAVTVALLLSVASYSIVSNTVVLIGTVMAERLFYLPTVGLCVAAGPSLAAAGRSLGGRGRYALAVAGCVLLLVDWRRAGQWASPVSLFESAVRAQPRSARAHMELATAYGVEGRIDDAVSAFNAAVQIKPDYGSAWYNLANLYARNGDGAKAVETYRSALEQTPKLVPAWFNLGMTHRMMGDFADAAAAFATAVELAPNDPQAQSAYGDTLLTLGRNREAINAYSAALAAGIDPPSTLINRGVARQRLLGCAAALEDYLSVARDYPRQSTAVGNAIACLRELGRHAEAADLVDRSASVANQNTGR